MNVKRQNEKNETPDLGGSRLELCPKSLWRTTVRASLMQIPQYWIWRGIILSDKLAAWNYFKILFLIDLALSILIHSCERMCVRPCVCLHAYMRDCVLVRGFKARSPSNTWNFCTDFCLLSLMLPCHCWYLQSFSN